MRLSKQEIDRVVANLDFLQNTQLETLRQIARGETIEEQQNPESQSATREDVETGQQRELGAEGEIEVRNPAAQPLLGTQTTLPEDPTQRAVHYWNNLAQLINRDTTKKRCGTDVAGELKAMMQAAAAFAIEVEADRVATEGEGLIGEADPNLMNDANTGFNAFNTVWRDSWATGTAKIVGAVATGGLAIAAAVTRWMSPDADLGLDQAETHDAKYSAMAFGGISSVTLGGSALYNKKRADYAMRSLRGLFTPLDDDATTTASLDSNERRTEEEAEIQAEEGRRPSLIGHGNN